MKAQFMYWLKEPTLEENGYIMATIESLPGPIPMEVMNATIDEVELNKIYDVSVQFYCHQLNSLSTKAAFKKKNPNMLEESFIPIGSFSVNENADFEPAPISLINATIVDVYNEQSPEIPKGTVLVTAKLLGIELDMALFFNDEEEASKVKVNQIVSGIFYAEASIEF